MEQDNIAGNYFNKHESKNPFVRFVVRIFYKDILKYVKMANPKKILDVGCGEGYVTNFVKQNFDAYIEGCDISDEIIEKAKILNSEISFYTGSAYNLKQDKNSFDLVMAIEILEHLQNPEKALKELKKVTEKYCIISVPHEPWWRIANVLRLAYLKKFGNTPGHVQHFTRRKLKKLLLKRFSTVRIKNSTVWLVALCEK